MHCRSRNCPQLSATVLPEKAAVKDIVWSTSNDKVVKVSQDGTIEAVMGGEATVTATAKDGSGVTASCKVTVVNPRFLLTYEVDGAVYATDSVTFGTTITPVDTPTKDGYTFSGWSGVPTTMPAKDVTVTGTFTANPIKEKQDVNGDGCVDSQDVLQLYEAIKDPNSADLEMYDINGDGIVDTQDVLNIYDYMKENQ